MRDAGCVKMLVDGLEPVQRTPGITLGVLYERFDPLVRQHASRITHPVSRVFEGTPHNRSNMSLRERLEHEHPTPRQQRPRQLEARVLGGRPDQRHDAVLDPREKRVLLRLVEAVYLLAEQDRAAPLVLQALFGGLDDLADSAHALGDGRERFELAVGVVGDNAREGGLPRSGRAPEDARPDLAAADQLAQRLPRAEQVLLTEELVERRGSHAGGKRLGGAGEESRIRHKTRDGEWGMGDAW